MCTKKVIGYRVRCTAECMTNCYLEPNNILGVDKGRTTIFASGKGTLYRTAQEALDALSRHMNPLWKTEGKLVRIVRKAPKPKPDVYVIEWKPGPGSCNDYYNFHMAKNGRWTAPGNDNVMKYTTWAEASLVARNLPRDGAIIQVKACKP